MIGELPISAGSAPAQRAWSVDFKHGSTVNDQRTNVHDIRWVR